MTQENFLIFFQVKEVLVFLDVFTLSDRLFVHFGLFDWLSCVLSKEKSHVNEEDYQEFSNWYDCKLQRDFDSTHAYFFDAYKLASCEFMGHSGIIVIIHKKVQQYVECYPQLMLELLL